MKNYLHKILIVTVLTFTVSATNSIHASSKHADIQYLKELGYGKKENNNQLIFPYNSGWKKFLGGDWRHGVTFSQVWSEFKHATKVHKTTVRGAGGYYSYSDWQDPGVMAEASWERAWLTKNGAWADVK